MKYSILGKSNISVSKLCFGTLTMGPLQKNLPLNEGVGLLELAAENGVNFFDTAQIYRTYSYIRELIKHRPKAVICTKSYSYDEATANESFKAAVEGIGRDYIDIFLLHEQESEHTLRGHYEALEFFLKKKQQGFIGAVGISTHYIAGVLGANKYPELDIVFPLINKTGIGIADGDTNGMLHAINRSYEQNKGVIAMKPLGGGHLLAAKDEAFKYLLNQECIHSIAVGVQSEAELLYNCALFSGEAIDESITAKIEAQQRRLLIHDWCEGCGACVKRCKNKALSMYDNMAVVDNSKCALCGYCAGVCPQFCIKVV